MKELEPKDKKYLWHPFTNMKTWMEEPITIIDKANNSYLSDIQGRQYLDGVSSLWVLVHGHNNPFLNKALQEQLNKVAHSTMLGLSNVPAILLAEGLIKIAPPGLKRVFYSDNGSCAVEIALKIAFQFWQNKGERQRTLFLSLDRAYHGDTIGAVSIGNIQRFHKLFKPLLFSTLKIPAPYCYRCEFSLSYPKCKFRCIQEARRLIKGYKEKIAALVIEPLVQGAGGMIVAPSGYLRQLRDICKEEGIIFICDEVATGFGRTGTMFACQQEDVSPDIMTLGKGITGGYLPLAATLCTEEIFEGFLDKGETLYHGHSYTGNQLACAVAIANLELFNTQKVIEGLAPKIAYLKEELKKFLGLRHVGEVRQKGFMVGIELVKDKLTKESFPSDLKIGVRVAKEALKRGVFIRPLEDVIVLMPPLSIKQEELHFLTKVVFESIQHILGN
jgi:adenosylmethionine-8-amino-7-oxononanoate aminotransferase